MSEKSKRKVNCGTCEEMPNQNIHYDGHIIQNINRLPMGKVVLGELEKLGWVVWKVILQ